MSNAAFNLRVPAENLRENKVGFPGQVICGTFIHFVNQRVVNQTPQAS